MLVLSQAKRACCCTHKKTGLGYWIVALLSSSRQSRTGLAAIALKYTKPYPALFGPRAIPWESRVAIARAEIISAAWVNSLHELTGGHATIHFGATKLVARHCPLLLRSFATSYGITLAPVPCACAPTCSEWSTVIQKLPYVYGLEHSIRDLGCET